VGLAGGGCSKKDAPVEVKADNYGELVRELKGIVRNTREPTTVMLHAGQVAVAFTLSLESTAAFLEVLNLDGSVTLLPAENTIRVSLPRSRPGYARIELLYPNSIAASGDELVAWVSADASTPAKRIADVIREVKGRGVHLFVFSEVGDAE
jgi:hypothetical protein